MKRVFLWILTLALLTGLFFCTAIGVSADEVLFSSCCGTNAIWRLYESGTLVISGTGMIDSYDFEEDEYSSWYPLNHLITNVVIEDGITHIGEEAFRECDVLQTITIPDSVVSIGHSAFKDCLELTSVTIPDNVYSINYYTFENCSSLTSVTIGSRVSRIETGAFFNCSSLRSITIPNSVTNIAEGVFKGCSSLESITIPFVGGSRKTPLDTYHDAFGHLFGTYSYAGAVATTQKILSSGFTYSRTYYISSSLKSVTVTGDYVLSYAFYNCTNLTEVTLTSSLISIGDYAFSGCSGLKRVNYTGSQQQWNAVSIGSKNDSLLSATLSFNHKDHNCAEHRASMIIKSPTFTSVGERLLYCTKCGDSITETIPMLVGAISKWNVSLEDDILVNFYMDITESMESTAKVRIYVGENAYTFPVSTLEKTADGLYIAQVSAAAAQMNDFIYISVINGSSTGPTYSYTIRQYADTILADSAHSAYHALVKEMLNYGAAAQVYFDHEANNLADTGIGGTGTTEIPDTVDSEMTVTGKANGISFHGATLIFRSRIAVRYYFSFEGQINNMTFTANGQQYAPQLKDGLYYIEIADILPQNLDQQITLTVTDASGNALSVAYGPMNYIVRMNTTGSESLKNLLKALYNYHLAAKAL